MAVTQKPDGRWAVVFRDRDTGRQRWKYFARGVEAEAAARAFDAELKSSGAVKAYAKRTKAPFAPTLTELAEAYLAAKQTTMAKATMTALFHKLKSVILPLIGHLRAVRLTPAALDKYVQTRLETALTVKAGSKTAPRMKALTDAQGKPRFPKMTTIHRELTDVQAVLNWAVGRRLIPHNPVAGYAKPTRDDSITRAPSTSEVSALLRHAAPHLARALIIAYYTGLRPGAAELYRLTWDDVDMDAGEVFVTSAKKGGLRSRRVPIHQGFLEKLKLWRDADKGRGPLVHYRGKPVTTIKTAFAAAKRRAGITRRLRPYDFRHAFATAVLAAGADLKSTSELLGHGRVDTTLRVYQHTSRDLHRDAIGKLPSLDDGVDGDPRQGVIRGPGPPGGDGADPRQGATRGPRPPGGDGADPRQGVIRGVKMAIPARG